MLKQKEMTGGFEGGVGLAGKGNCPWSLHCFSYIFGFASPPTHSSSSSFLLSSIMPQAPLPPPPPPQWVVALNSPLPRPSKAASSIPDPPGFTSSRTGSKQVSRRSRQKDSSCG